MDMFSGCAVRPARFLLPAEGCDMSKWAVIACDQHTSEPEYWDKVLKTAGDAPTALDMIYPEAWLSRGDGYIDTINENMRRLRAETLTRAAEGFIFTERETTDGVRFGLICAVDLEKYDFASDSRSEIRPTEATVPSRVPPRMKIRRGACLEAGHVLLLADDTEDRLLGPLKAAHEEMPVLYDFELMLGGGHIKGYMAGMEYYPAVAEAMEALREKGARLTLAVGDGNHSLAAARGCWLEIRETLTAEERETHPARFAMVEINNIYDEATVFHPIHRAVFGDTASLGDELAAFLAQRGMTMRACGADEATFALNGTNYVIDGAKVRLAVTDIEPFLDMWRTKHPEGTVDYIHGDDTLAMLGEKGAATIALRAMDKMDLFRAVRISPLPRKTFSMGEACDKRYYLETREIVKR